MDQQPISAARFPDLLPGPPEASAAWSAFTVYVVEPPVRATMTSSDHVLAVQISGTCRLRQELNGRVAEGLSGPGSVTVIPAKVKGRWEGRGHAGTSRAITLFVPGAYLSRLIAQNWNVEPSRVEIIGRFLARDPVIDGLLTRLALE